MKERIHKVLAGAGFGSRREIERWINEGRIKVNGRSATIGQSVSARDRVEIDGKPVSLRSSRRRGPRVILYHKPEGEVCTRSPDEKRPTVYRNLPVIRDGRWISVGRLDLNTSGLLMFTDDGELANTLMHPSTGLEREYMVRVRGTVSEDILERLQKGFSLDGRRAKFERIHRTGRATGQNQWYRVVIMEGRYREVRRLWEKVGCQVSRLKRIRYGSVSLPRNLKQGAHIKLPPAQLQKLLGTAGISAKSRQNEDGSHAGDAAKKRRQRQPHRRSRAPHDQ